LAAQLGPSHPKGCTFGMHACTARNLRLNAVATLSFQESRASSPSSIRKPNALTGSSHKRAGTSTDLVWPQYECLYGYNEVDPDSVAEINNAPK
jgi:hypothetical protein